MKTKISRRRLTVMLALCAATGCALTAYAAITPTLLAKGTIAFYQRFNGPADTYVIRATAEPGDTTGWHYHPGPATVIFTRGTFTEEEGCGGVRQFTAGQALTEEGGPGSVHQVTNTGTEQGEFYFLVTVPQGSPRTVPVAGPRCGPPTDKQQCEDGGWMKFNFPRTFKSQHDCIRFVKGDRDDDERDN